MNITIKKATESDLPIIQSFGARLLEFEKKNYDPSLDLNWPFTEEAKAKYLSAIKEKHTIIAEVDGKPAGYLIGKIIEHSTSSARNIKQAYLENIFVDESLRHNKIGKKLIADFEKYCLDEGVQRINVSVLTDNTVAVDFYKKTGFLPRSLNLSKKSKTSKNLAS